METSLICSVRSWLLRHDFPTSTSGSFLKTVMTVPLPSSLAVSGCSIDNQCHGLECIGRVDTLKLSDSLLRIRLRLFGSHNQWRKAMGGKAWAAVLSAAYLARLDFGYAYRLREKLVLVTEAVCDFAGGIDVDLMVEGLFTHSFESLQKVYTVAVGHRGDTERGDDMEASVSYSENEELDESRERVVQRIAKTEDLYTPAESLAVFFLPVTEMTVGGVEYIQVEIDDWEKAYRNAAIPVSDISSFFLSLYDKGVKFGNLPWGSLYCKKGSLWEVRLAAGVRKTDVVELRGQGGVDREEYHFNVIKEWVREKEKKTEMGKVGILKEMRSMEDVTFIPSSRFQHSQLDSPSLILGQGGFGYVYLNTLGREKVALKGYNPSRPHTANALLSEVQIMTQLRHTSIVKMFGVAEYGERIMMVLERCEYSMLDYVKRNEKLQDAMPMNEKLKILMKIADAIATLHQQDICHFDLKPHNILMKTVKRKGKPTIIPKISDFGMASLRRPNGTWRKPGYTPGYSSPEQLQSYNFGPASDVWSFSMLSFYFLLCYVPFGYLSQGSKRNAEEKKIYFLKELGQKKRKPLIPMEFQSNHPCIVGLLRQCWHSNINARPTMKAVCERLDQLRTAYKRSERSNKDV